MKYLKPIHYNMKKNIPILLFVCLVFLQSVDAQYNYPYTKAIPVVDNYFGTLITDNYRWLENLNDTSVQQWLKAQADFSNNMLDKINGREMVINRLEEFQNMGGDLREGMVQRGNKTFYSKKAKDQNLYKIFMQVLPDSNEELLFDPESFGKGIQVMDFFPSDNGNYMALKLANGGNEICEVRILDIKTKKLLPDSLGPILNRLPIVFVSNDKEIIYTKTISTDTKNEDVLKNQDVYLHIIGTDVSYDKVIFSRTKYSQLNVLPEQIPIIFVSNDKKYLFLRISSVKNDRVIYYADYNELHNKKINWKILISPNDEITQWFVKGNQLYFLTSKNAPNFKIGVTSMIKPDFENAAIILPEGKDVISSMQSTKNHLFYSANEGTSLFMYQIDFKTLTTKKLPLPEGINWGYALNEARNDKLIIYNSSWLSPYLVYEYDAAKTKLVKSKWFDMSGDFPDYNKDFAVKEVEVESYDGVMVPLTILYPKNMIFNGSTPCYITGYGGYGRSVYPEFIDNMKKILLEQGCCIAIAHVRGGGEKGEEWHKAGMKSTKQNTWKDFIACAEYLISQKYTEPQKLIAEGMSMGGLLIGRAVTERPDLFSVVIVEVGLTNTLRMETTPNGNNQIPELGSVKVEGDIKSLIEMDAQSKVVQGTKYPAVFVRMGMNDVRVAPWMPAKFAAALQNSTISDKPVLLYVNYDNGHFTSDVDVNNKEFADMVAFSLWLVGHAKFTTNN